jgi:hypothetical protein
VSTQGTAGGRAKLTVDPTAWKKRPGDVQRAVEEIATMMEVPAPTVEGDTVEFPVSTEERDRALRLWRECHERNDLLKPPR